MIKAASTWASSWAACLTAAIALAGCAKPQPAATVVLAPPDRPAASTLPDLDRPADWRSLDAILREHVNDDGRIDYFQASRNPAFQELLDLYACIARTGPRSRPACYPSPPDKLVYYANAHNLLAIVAIAPRFAPGRIDPRQVSELPGRLEADFVFVLDGQQVTLERIAGRVAELMGPDPRPLLTLTAGRRNDPPLRAEAYRAERWDAQLADQLVRVLRDSTWCDIDHRKRRIAVPPAIANHREYYWAAYGKLAATTQPADVGQGGILFSTVLFNLADPAGRRWLNRAIGYDVVAAEPSDLFNDKPLFRSYAD